MLWISNISKRQFEKFRKQSMVQQSRPQHGYLVTQMPFLGAKWLNIETFCVSVRVKEHLPSWRRKQRISLSGDNRTCLSHLAQWTPLSWSPPWGCQTWQYNEGWGFKSCRTWRCCSLIEWFPTFRRSSSSQGRQLKKSSSVGLRYLEDEEAKILRNVGSHVMTASHSRRSEFSETLPWECEISRLWGFLSLSLSLSLFLSHTHTHTFLFSCTKNWFFLQLCNQVAV